MGGGLRELVLARCQCHVKEFGAILMICYYILVFVILYFNDGFLFLTRPWECSCTPIVQS